MLNEVQNPGEAVAQLPLLAAADLQDSLMVATNDLDRLQRLLADATETLMGHFYGASDHLRHLSRLAAPSCLNPTCTRRWATSLAR